VVDPALWGDESDADRWELGPQINASENAPNMPYTPTTDDVVAFADWSGEQAAREHLDASEQLAIP
jgi:hypothetical protein